MGHLSVYPSVGACDTLDGHVGAVGVPVFIHSGIAVCIHILGRHLAVGKELLKPLVAGHEPAFAVGYRVHINAAQLCFCKPRGLIGDHLKVHHLGDMTSDGVVGQRRRAGILLRNGAARHEPQLDESLESVADA